MSHQLMRSQYVELLPINDINKINYYINIIENQNLSVRQLKERIKSNEYERLPKSTKKKLIAKKDVAIKELVPEPIIIKTLKIYKY